MDTVELTHDNGDGTAVRMARSLSPDRVAGRRVSSACLT